MADGGRDVTRRGQGWWGRERVKAVKERGGEEGAASEEGDGGEGGGGGEEARRGARTRVAHAWHARVRVQIRVSARS